MDPLQQFRDTILGAGNIQAPTSPLGDFPELRNYYASSFKLPAAQAGGNALSNQAGIMEGNRREQETYAREQEAARLKARNKEIEDLSDPKKYQKILKEDGGFDYYDPTGKKITLKQYSLVVGKQPKDILKDSENNLDKQYLRDYDDLQALLNASYNGGLDKLLKKWEKDRADNPEAIDKIKLLRSGKLLPEDVTKQFMSAYPNVYSDEGRGEMGKGLFPSKPQPKRGGFQLRWPPNFDIVEMFKKYAGER